MEKNLSKVTEVLKKSQMKITELKDTVTNKNSLMDSRVEWRWQRRETIVEVTESVNLRTEHRIDLI